MTTTQQCVAHPGTVAAGPCVQCARPHCARCLAELLGAYYCPVCRVERLAALQGLQPVAQAQYPPGYLRGTGRVELGRWLGEGWTMASAQAVTWVLATLLGFVLALLTCGSAGPAVSVGLLRMAFRQRRGERIEVLQVLEGFRHFLPALGLVMLMTVPLLLPLALVLAAFAVLATGGNEAVSAGLFLSLLFAGYGLAIVIGVAVSTVTFFSLAHEAATRSGPVAAIRESWLVVRRNPWMFMLAAVVIGLVQSVGLSACYLGLLFTVPWSLAALAQAYVDHFGQQGPAGPVPVSPVGPG
jgi:hypothetical protein